MFSDSRVRFLLITCLFINAGSTQRRDAYNYRSSCRFSPCIENRTIFDTSTKPGCYCDESCYKIFHDCCPDYEEYCGQQEPPERGISMWKCVESFNATSWSKIDILGATGVWMISRCPNQWPLGDTRTRCENAPSEFSFSAEDYLPVIGEESWTYRNKFCALCNDVENYTSWSVKVGGDLHAMPPEEFDLNAKLSFIKSNGGKVGHFYPGSGQPWRLCFGKNYIDYCLSRTDPATRRNCLDGPVEVVVKEFIFFKNKACSQCGNRPRDTYTIVLIIYHKSPTRTLSIVFKLKKEKGKTTLVERIQCPSGAVYDTNLHFCRKGFIVSPGGELANEYLVITWFLEPNQPRVFGFNLTVEMNKLKYNYKQALASEFLFETNQISRLQFHEQDSFKGSYVATFVLTLTFLQSLAMANRTQTLFNVTNESVAFLDLLNFTRNYTASWNERNFLIYKVISKRLSCYGLVRFQPSEYIKINGTNGNYIVDKSGKVYSLEEFTLVQEEGGHVTLCRKLILSNCRKGAYVPLNSEEYVIFPNLSVYHNATQNMFNFGEYLIDDNSTSPKYFTISVCLSFKNTFNKTKINFSPNKKSYALKVLTTSGFIVSIICLILLLVTYGLFRELRTVPGMNLMNLSISMLLSDLIWLIGTSHFTGTTACNVFAILEHYLFLVSFLSMSVISYHSFLVFSRPFDGRHLNTSYKRFIKYSAVVWLSPAIFVAICVTLDETEIFPVDYGTNCWLGTVKGILYLFLLPLAISLLYNIYTFIKTVRLLLRHDETREVLQRKEGKQNLLICTKLATLVGFPWLFAFLGVLFPDEVVFEYLFVILVCLQGLYIGIAFVFNKKTLDLYKTRHRQIGPKGKASPTARVK